MGEIEVEKVDLEQLLTTPESYLGKEVVTSGRLLSYSSSEFWLITDVNKLRLRQGLVLVHSDLNILLYENVPTIGGSYAFYHPTVVTGIMQINHSCSPSVHLTDLTQLIVTTSGRIYDLL